MSLSPWDLGAAISFDFSLYRPRRASYVYATRASRGQRNESYRHATKQHTSSTASSGTGGGRGSARSTTRTASPDVASGLPIGSCSPTIDDVETTVVVEKRALRKKRPESYRAAVKRGGLEAAEAATADERDDAEKQFRRDDPHDVDKLESKSFSSTSTLDLSVPISRGRCTKNLVVLSVGFVFVFAAFRALQNLQTTMHSSRVGALALALVHGTALATCLTAPFVASRLGPRWSVALAVFAYPLWVGANFCLGGGALFFVVLIVASCLVGVGQSVAWSAQVAYVRRLAAAIDSSHFGGSTPSRRRSSVYRCNGFFLACFQTTHIWGNLISSIVLGSDADLRRLPVGGDALPFADPQDGVANVGAYCGTYDTCDDGAARPGTSLAGVNASSSNTFVCRAATGFMTTTMLAYLTLSLIGLFLLLFLLDNIKQPTKIEHSHHRQQHQHHQHQQQEQQQQVDPKLSQTQVIKSNIRRLFNNRTFVCLIPLLLFNGFDQGFVYAIYNKSYVACTIGMEYIGYSMIAVGVTNAVCSCLIGCAARYVPREALVGIGCVLHAALMVFLLVWIPDGNLMPVFFVLSALWGVCDAIWQTQSNGLVNQCCSEDVNSGESEAGNEAETERDFAFQTVRLVQGFGATTVFVLGAVTCDVAIHLYVLVVLLSMAVLGYVAAEYRLRRLAAVARGLVTDSGAGIAAASSAVGGAEKSKFASTGANRSP